MITMYHRPLKQDELAVIDEPKAGTWLHAVAPNENERASLIERGFDAGLLSDALDRNEVPRFEYEDNIHYFFTRYPIRQHGELTTLPLLIAINEELVLTVATSELPFVERIVQTPGDLFTTQKTKLFLQLLSEVNTLYTVEIGAILRSVRKSRINLRTIRNRDIINFVTLESALNEFAVALEETNEGLKTIVSGKFLPLYESDTDMIEDLTLSNEQLVANAKANLATIQNIRSAYSTINTNNLNQVMKFLTALTVIFTIPTMISSMFGMNVPVPMANNPQAFWFILVLVSGIIAVAAYFFSRKDWI